MKKKSKWVSVFLTMCIGLRKNRDNIDCHKNNLKTITSLMKEQSNNKKE